MPIRTDQAGFLTTMRQRFQTAYNAWNETRQHMVRDIQFCDLNKQWETQDEANRSAAQRPCLTVNQVRQFKQQIVNQQRSARPGVKISPKGGGTDIATAEVLEGIIEHIEHPDDLAPAETWIDIAFDNMVTSGLGYLTWYTRYKPKTRLQEIVIDGIENPLSVYMDPSFRQPDSMDKRYTFITIDYSEDEFRRKYKKSVTATKTMVTDLQGLGDQTPNWLPDGQVRVAVYFYLETEDVAMVEVEDPSSLTGTKVMTAEDADAFDKEHKKGDRLVRVGTHTEQQTRCRRAVVTGSEVLEGDKNKTQGAEIVADLVPVIPVFGDMSVLNGKRYVAGMVRYMRDPARMINFLVSALAENIALMPKPKWLAEFSTIEDFKEMWRDANNAAYSALTWTAKAGPDGQPLPPPQMLVNEPPIQAIVEGLQVFTNMIQATASLHDPSLGKQKSDQSGRAVALLQQQGQVGTLNWQDNLTRAMKALYRQLVQAIPKVYDVPQVMKIMRRTDQQDAVLIHAGNPPGNLPAGHGPMAPPKDLVTQYPELEGVKQIYDLADLEFKVEVDTGPNFNTKRQENQAWLLEVAKIMPPQQLAVITPLLAEYSDAPVSQQVAAILKKVVGPELYPSDDQQPMSPEAQHAIQQLQSTLQTMTQELHAKNQYIETEQVKSDERVKIEGVKQDAAIKLAQINNAAKAAVAWITATKGGTVLQEQRDEAFATGLAMVHEAHENALDRAHEVGMAALEHGHEVIQAQQGADNAAAASAQDHTEALDQAEQGNQHAQEQTQQAADLAPEPAPAGGEGQ